MTTAPELTGTPANRTIFERVQTLNFPLGQYVVVGGAMEALGIRLARDVDIIATEGLITTLLDRGWEAWPFKPEDQGVDGKKRRVAEGDVHVKSEYSCNNVLITPTEELIATAVIIQDLPFAAIGHILRWKTASSREKDKEDVKLIHKYLEEHSC